MPAVTWWPRLDHGDPAPPNPDECGYLFLEGQVKKTLRRRSRRKKPKAQLFPQLGLRWGGGVGDERSTVAVR